MNKNLYFCFFLLIASFASGQKDGEQLIHGKIIVKGSSIEGINVVNLVTERVTTTNKEGDFYIYAKVDDLLVITSVNLEVKRRLIEENDLKLEVINIEMIPKMNVLKEVIVNENANINAVSLRIIPKGQKKYSPAERKIYTAKSGFLDRPLNWMSGRTSMLKKELIVEKKEKLLVKLDGVFEEEFYTEEMLIPAEYVKGFKYYIIEDNDFANALLAKNKTLMRYLIPRLAINYNQIINEGN